MEHDERMMKRCLHLARMGEYYVAPNPMVGAVLCDNRGRVVSEGRHARFGTPHAEVVCINNALKKGLTDFSSTTLYVSLEPCSHFGKTPPCADLIIEKKIPEVVIGTLDPNPLVAGNGMRKLIQAGIKVRTGILEQQCREINKRFICFHEKKRPFVILKWAQSADGFIDMKREWNEKQTPPPARLSTDLTKRIVHKMRAENMAILIGSNTAIMDNPLLINRKWVGRHPTRILLDRRGRVTQDANIFSQDAPTIVYRDNTLWPFVLNDLYQRNIHSVLVEGGAQVLHNILQTTLWDEIHIEIAPITLHNGIPAPPPPQLPYELQQIDGNHLYTFLSNAQGVNTA